MSFAMRDYLKIALEALYEYFSAAFKIVGGILLAILILHFIPRVF